MHFYPRPPRGGRRRTVNTEANPHEISIHALREEGDWLRRWPPCGWSRYFYPRPPRGGRRAGPARLIDLLGISIHALREEGDPSSKCTKFCVLKKFLSTPSARRATPFSDRRKKPVIISIHALREEGDQPFRPKLCKKVISIHALREEGDCLFGGDAVHNHQFLSTPSARRATVVVRRGVVVDVISIHALREEGDRQARTKNHPDTDFYPRPPRGGRPHRGEKQVGQRCDFYPRPPRGGRLPQVTAPAGGWAISIHALREEGDVFQRRGITLGLLFLSTPSARRATETSKPKSMPGEISIHALREEGDPRASRPAREPTDFYPRPPRGGRRLAGNVHFLRGGFLSTPSARRATVEKRNDTHAQHDFYPRPPRGGRPDELGELITNREISIHALREEGDPQAAPAAQPTGRFLSTPSARRATPKGRQSIGHNVDFYPRPPRGGRLHTGRRWRPA